MIDVKNITTFQDFANEVIILLVDDGCRLRDTYPLWRRWEELRRSLPKSDQPSHPWIVADLPTKSGVSHCFSVDHPTNPDDRWSVEYMPGELSIEDEREVIDVLLRHLRAWLRAEQRRQPECTNETWFQIDRLDHFIGGRKKIGEHADSEIKPGIRRERKQNSTHYRYFVRTDLIDEYVKPKHRERYKT